MFEHMFNTVPVDDRSTRARIRDAAIAEIAAAPAGKATVRDIAARADVSPGSVIHHFGSIDGLRRACNEHVTELIRHYKTEAVQNPLAFNPLTTASELGDLPITAYIAKVATSTAPEVGDLIDLLVRDAAEYIETGVAAGTIIATTHPQNRAALLVLWSLGALVLHGHVERHLGVDLTDPDMITDPSAGGYMFAAFDLLSNGLLMPEVAGQFLETIESYYSRPSDTNSEPNNSKGPT